MIFETMYFFQCFKPWQMFSLLHVLGVVLRLELITKWAVISRIISHYYHHNHPVSYFWIYSYSSTFPFFWVLILPSPKSFMTEEGVQCLFLLLLALFVIIIIINWVLITAIFLFLVPTMLQHYHCPIWGESWNILPYIQVKWAEPQKFRRKGTTLPREGWLSWDEYQVFHKT